jgi:hypothetical protein
VYTDGDGRNPEMIAAFDWVEDVLQPFVRELIAKDPLSYRPVREAIAKLRKEGVLRDIKNDLKKNSVDDC